MKRLPVVLTLVLALGACASEPAPRDTFYRLDIAQPAQRFAQPVLPGVLEVNRLEADGVVGERAMAYADDEGGALRRYRYEFWSEPPGQMLQDRLTAVLKKAGAAERVVSPDLRVPPDWTLRGKIKRFEQVAAADRVAVELQLAVVSARNGALVMVEDYAAQSPTRSDDPHAVAEAAGRAVADIFSHFLADLGRAQVPDQRR